MESENIGRKPLLIVSAFIALTYFVLYYLFVDKLGGCTFTAILCIALLLICKNVAQHGLVVFYGSRPYLYFIYFYAVSLFLAAQVNAINLVHQLLDAFLVSILMMYAKIHLTKLD